VDVVVVDKARTPGGRLCTHRTSYGLAFDHGAQYLTIRNPWFRRALQPLVEAGTVARWTGRLAVAGPGATRPAEAGPERWVAVPSMSALPRALAEGLAIRAHTRVIALRREGGQWALEHEGPNELDEDELDDASELAIEAQSDGAGPPQPELGRFDRVVIATPAADAAALLTELPALQQLAQAVPMEPCWALMLYMPGVYPTGYDGAFVHDSPLAWVMREPSKPGRPEYESWVLHATPAWSRAHWDDHHLVVSEAMLEAWHARGGPSPRAISQTLAHRWRYALVDPRVEPRAAGDDVAGVALAGDWLGGGRVEGAFLSGRRAAAGVLRSLRRANYPAVRM
jgi:hypothetical protein